jgi:2-polyprenyl-3-methyl-5-hydroxy-6-metoxy-1,4-benzoquinol methylase
MVQLHNAAVNKKEYLLMNQAHKPELSHTENDINDWNRIAATYSSKAGTQEDTIYRMFRPVIWQSLDPVDNAAVLDVGCGSGWLCHFIHSAGGKVIGVDGSAALLKIAREAYPSICFVEYNLANGLPTFDIQFDRIVANMVLMDISDIQPVIAAIRKVIKPQGKFIFTLPHPCFFQAPIVRDVANDKLYRKVYGYLKPEVWRILSFGGHNHYHRSLSYYTEQLRAHEFAITRLYEPAHITAKAVDEKDKTFYEDIPVFIFVEAIPINSL